MSDIFERAKALIETAHDHPDPEAEMEALEAEAGDDPEAEVMFWGLWEALELKLNEKVGPNDQD